jgi:gliding motility-associated lipoprotein GldH
MIRKNKSSLIIILFALVVIFGCQKERVYNKTYDIPENKWNKNNIVNFKVPVEDTLTAHNVYLHVRHLSKYDFQNLFLFVNISSPEGYSVKDTFECMLANDKGQWYGSGWGDVYHNKILYKKNILFPASGTYSFELQQAMRKKNLKHVSDVGLEIKKSNQKIK